MIILLPRVYNIFRKTVPVCVWRSRSVQEGYNGKERRDDGDYDEEAYSEMIGGIVFFVLRNSAGS